MTIYRPLDPTDLRILAEIQQDGRIPIVEIAKRVNLSKSPCLVRLKRLEKDGYVRGYTADLDPDSIDQSYVVFVEIKLKRTTKATLEKFNRAVREAPEIQMCHMVAGGYDYLLKVRTANMQDYRRLLGDVIGLLPGVLQTTTYPSMEEVKDTRNVNLEVAMAASER